MCVADPYSNNWYTTGADQLIYQRDPQGNIIQTYSGLTGKAMAMAVTKGRLLTTGM